MVIKNVDKIIKSNANYISLYLLTSVALTKKTVNSNSSHKASF